MKRKAGFYIVIEAGELGVARYDDSEVAGGWYVDGEECEVDEKRFEYIAPEPMNLRQQLYCSGFLSIEEFNRVQALLTD